MSEPGGRFRPSERLPLAEGLWPGWMLCPLMGKQEEEASCCTGAQMGAGGLDHTKAHCITVYTTSFQPWE